MNNIFKSMKSRILLVLVLSLMIVATMSLVACGNDEDNAGDNIVTETDRLEDGTYQMSGMREGIPRHKENFGDTLLVEKKDGIYYVTIEILNNKSVERVYWKGRRDTMADDAKIVVDGDNTKYMFAFDNKNVQKKLKFVIGGGRMPFDPPFEFAIDFDGLTKTSDTIVDTERPAVFL